MAIFLQVTSPQTMRNVASKQTDPQHSRHNSLQRQRQPNNVVLYKLKRPSNKARQCQILHYNR